MFTKQELAARHQHATHLAQGLQRIGNAAQGVGADHGVKAGIGSGQLLGRQAHQLDCDTYLLAALLGQAVHLHGRIHAHQAGDATAVVKRQIAPGAHAHFEHTALRLGHQLAALLLHHGQAASDVDQIR